MTTTESLVRMDEIEATPPSPVRSRKMLAIGAAAIVTVAGFAAVVTKTDQERTRPQRRRPRCRWMKSCRTSSSGGRSLGRRCNRRRSPGRRGCRTSSSAGSIPRQALQPAPLTREERLQDLVVRGLIPRQALEPAP